MNNSNLHDLNAAKLSVNIPAIVYISVMMVIGSVGNFFVLVVFGFQMKRRSAYKLFVLAMAIYDMAACCLAMPGLLVDMLNPFMFYSSVGCKTLRYGYHVIACSTSMTHMQLGIDRYRRICKPLNTQITISSTRRVLGIQFWVALVVAVPSVLVADSSTVGTGIKDIVGRHCGISDTYSDTLFPILYESFLSVLVVATVILLVVCYILIGRELYLRSIFLRSLKQQFNIPDQAIQNEKIPKAKSARRAVFKNKVKPDTSNIENDLHSLTESSNEVQMPNCNEQHVLSEIGTQNEVCPETNREIRSSDVMNTTTQARMRKQAVGELTSRRLTAVTFTITLVYIISYFPFLALQFLNICITDFEKYMTFSEEATFEIFIYSYALNNVVNPIVYLVIDTEFRMYSKAIVCALRDKLR